MEEQKQQKHYMRSIINFLQGIAFSILIFSIILAIYLIIIYCTRPIPYTNYAIVFDAGSSHTEMFIYHWPADKSNGLGTTSTANESYVCPLATVTIPDPHKKNETIKLKAISDFEQHLELLESYFQPCLKEAILRIPSDRHKFSPIFLGATAGMRLARLYNKVKSDQILEKIREIFSNLPFQFVVNRQVRILTGMEEAIDGWITTNILLEKFRHRHVRKNSTKRIQSKNNIDPDMVGVLDLGGASTQVTFTYIKDVNQERIPDEFTTNITLFDTVYSPYAHSYLCWGKNEAFKRHRARLVNAALNRNRINFSNSTRISIHDPCLARGTNDTLKLNSIFHSPCTANEKEKFNSTFNKLSIIFLGAGNTSQCRQRLFELFDSKRNDKTVNCTYNKDYCTFDHTFQPRLPQNIHFIGLSGYYYVFNNLAYGMRKPREPLRERYELKNYTKQEIAERLINVCETLYSTLYEQENMTSNSEQHKRNLCFDGLYMWLLLTYAIGFKDNDLERVTFANKFPTGKVGWSLGYMINQTNYIPAEYRERLLKKKSFIAWLSSSLTIALITFIFLLFTCYLYCKPNRTITKKNDGYAQPNEQIIA